MDDKKKVSVTTVVINWIAAILWNITFFSNLVHGYATAESFRIHLLCAIAWDLCAIVWTARYLEFKRNNQ